MKFFKGRAAAVLESNLILEASSILSLWCDALNRPRKSMKDMVFCISYDFRGPCCFAEYGKEIPFTLSYFSLDANTLSSL